MRHWSSLCTGHIAPIIHVMSFAPYRSESWDTNSSLSADQMTANHLQQQGWELSTTDQVSWDTDRKLVLGIWQQSSLAMRLSIVPYRWGIMKNWSNLCAEHMTAIILGNEVGNEHCCLTDQVPWYPLWMHNKHHDNCLHFFTIDSKHTEYERWKNDREWSSWSINTQTQHTWKENPGGCKPFILKVAQVEMEGMREPHETLAGTAGDSDNQNVPPSTLSTFAVSKKMAQCSSPGSAGPFLETPNCW